jgi:hypothetical protein
MRKVTALACAVALASGLFAAPPAHAGWPFKKKSADASAQPAEKPAEKPAAEERTDDGGRVVKGKHDIEGEIIGEAAPGSPFRKLEIGMSQTQVNDLIGMPKECGSYITGKAFIPFHFGSDNARTECNYKGAGRLIFSQQSNGAAYLLKIVNDASEDGYR